MDGLVGRGCKMAYGPEPEDLGAKLLEKKEKVDAMAADYAGFCAEYGSCRGFEKAGVQDCVRAVLFGRAGWGTAFHGGMACHLAPCSPAISASNGCGNGFGGLRGRTGGPMP